MGFVPRYYCNTLPIELHVSSQQLGAGHIVSLQYTIDGEEYSEQLYNRSHIRTAQKNVSSIDHHIDVHYCCAFIHLSGQI